MHAVLTLDDLAPVMTKRRMMRHSNSGTPLDRMWCFALADGEVSYVGEPVAIVIADSRYIAEDAAALVDVDYDLLPAVSDCRKAIAADAPAVRRELNSNIVATYRGQFRRSPTPPSPRPRMCSTPTSGSTAAPAIRSKDAASSPNTIAAPRASPSGPRPRRRTTCSRRSPRCSTSTSPQLRVTTPEVGGGFGPKLCIYSEDIAVVAAAKLLKRSIKWIEDRREHFTNAAQERDQYWSIDIAVNADAKVLGIRGNLVHDVGAYALQDVNIPFNSASMMSGPYIVPSLHMDVVVAATNKTPVSSIRGAGYPQAAFSMERMMDRVARELKLDRAEVRRRNLIPTEKMPYTKPLKARSGAQHAIRQRRLSGLPGDGAEGRRLGRLPEAPGRARAQGRYIGIGLAHGIKGTGRGPFESGIVRVSNTGRSRSSPAPPLSDRDCARCWRRSRPASSACARRTSRWCPATPRASPLGLGAFASRQMVTAGNSVLLASRAVAEKAKKLASHLLEAAEHDLELKDGEVRVVGAPELSVKLAELSRILKGAPGYGFPPGVDPGLDANVNWRTDALAYANACHVAEVEVDIETGAVRILRLCRAAGFRRADQPDAGRGPGAGRHRPRHRQRAFEWMGYDDAPSRRGFRPCAAGRRHSFLPEPRWKRSTTSRKCA